MNARAGGLPLARCNKCHAKAMREGGSTNISQCMSLSSYLLDVIVISIFSRKVRMSRADNRLNSRWRF
ncbi:hypothetical protein FSC37_13150 [Piscinibacter aquaticus]|uniref:Uncharacterized protein n=1 Tax=Piscinibacter aquaticus TaxID=392597 RepID=A0A5C6U378_9BURK|nr:hypothetical protein FSC37_13150 [Piscinibacter aquaticus]